MGGHRNRRVRGKARSQYPEMSTFGAESDLHIHHLCISIEATIFGTPSGAIRVGSGLSNVTLLAMAAQRLLGESHAPDL